MDGQAGPDGQAAEVVPEADHSGQQQGEGRPVRAGLKVEQQGNECGGEEQAAAAHGGDGVGTAGVRGV